MEGGHEDRLRYEPALRVIGRHLDAEPAYHISVLEVADGFTVRSHASRYRSDGRDAHFNWERLRDLVIFQTAGRGLRRRRRRHEGIWASFPNGHEDFFRALGHMLDQEGANSLSVEELPEGVAISYTKPKSEDAGSFEKHHAVMQRDDVERMLQAAHHRRMQQSSATSG